MSDTPSSQSPDDKPEFPNVPVPNPPIPNIGHPPGPNAGQNPMPIPSSEGTEESLKSKAGSPPDGATPANSDEKNLAVISHALAFCGLIIPFGNILGPLILWLLKKDESPAVNYHAKEALNFQITVSLALVVCAILTFILIGFILMPIVGISALVITVIAVIKASQGEPYRYPFSLRLIS